MQIGNKVKLKTFNGSLQPDDNCQPNENYWKLIGSIGQIVKNPDEEGPYPSTSRKQRLLIRFEIDVKSLGLECHNKIQNSLWILESDLIEL